MGKFKHRWFGPYWIQYYLPNNTALLVTVEKFDPNPILVNINKLKLIELRILLPQDSKPQLEGEERH
jgi:hypothetical protein